MNKIITNIKTNKTAYIIGGVVVIIGLYILLKKSPLTKQSATQNDVNNLQAQGQVLSYPQSDYFTLAEQLDTELDSFIPSMTTITGVFNKMNNTLDVITLIQSYGTNGTAFHFSIHGIGSYTLPQFMNQMLSATDIQTINTLLRTKNINYQF